MICCLLWHQHKICSQSRFGEVKYMCWYPNFFGPCGSNSFVNCCSNEATASVNLHTEFIISCSQARGSLISRIFFFLLLCCVFGSEACPSCSEALYRIKGEIMSPGPGCSNCGPSFQVFMTVDLCLTPWSLFFVKLLKYYGLRIWITSMDRRVTARCPLVNLYFSRIQELKKRKQ